MSSLFEEDETSETQEGVLDAIGDSQLREDGGGDVASQVDSDVPDIAGLDEEERSDGILESREERPSPDGIGESQEREYGEEGAPLEANGQMNGLQNGSTAGSIMSIPDDTPSIQVRVNQSPLCTSCPK